MGGRWAETVGGKLSNFMGNAESGGEFATNENACRATKQQTRVSKWQRDASRFGATELAASHWLMSSERSEAKTPADVAIVVVTAVLLLMIT